MKTLDSSTEGNSLPEYLTLLEPGVWRLDVWVQPRASKTTIAGKYQDCLKIQLAAPAVDNKANKALIVFVSDLAGIRRGDIEFVSGQTSRKKMLRLHCGLDQVKPLIIS